MAAMAPALTDAPAEAHHIRFKLAAPSSSLSPASAENNGNASNILIHSSGPAKCKASSEECPLDFCGGDQEQQLQQQQPQTDSTAQASALGKLQPLVASYLCSDVTSVPSTKESIKLKGVLIKQSVLKSHRILPSTLLNGGDFLLRKRQAIELSGSQLKSLMSGSTNGGGQPMAPVNGLAKKLATMSGSGCVVAVNGDKTSATTDSQTQNLPLNSETLTATLSGHMSVKGTLKQKHSSGVSQNTDGSNFEPPVLQSTALSPFTHDNPNLTKQVNLEEEDSHTPTSQSQGSDRERPGSSQQGSPPCTPAPQPPLPCSSLDSLDAHVRERTLLNSNRQAEIEGRLRRLRKRLQVVQAKQVERHIQQQLGGFLDSALNRLLAGNRKSETAAPSATWRTGRHSSSGNRDGLSRFLKSGSMPLELERLYLSGTANLHSAESAFDSDVTESSSGGDSDLEEEELARVDIEQRHVKLWKRAESRYTVERAAIISHWNWLQAHISDLEYRIRQQTDIYKQIRASKGSVELGGVAPSTLPAGGIEVKAEPVSQDGSSERLEHMVATHIPTAEPGPWKGQNGQPVNGVLSRMTECADTKHQQPSAYDGTCVAARTRPLVSCRRRRLIQPNTVPNLNGKAQRSSCIQYNCRVNSSCVMCGGRPTPKEDPQYELPNLERLSRLDLGVHPILSFPDDVCIGLRLQQVMKSQWQTKALERSKPLKKLSLKHKLSSSKEKHKFTNSLMAVMPLVTGLGHYKSRADKQRAADSSVGSSSAVLNAARLEGQSMCKTERLPGLSTPLGPYDKSYSRKRLREHSLDRTDSSPKLFMDSGSPCSTLPSMHSAFHNPLTRQLSTSSENSAPLGASSQSIPTTPVSQPIKRRRGESSFDINNIVIPMSVAATTRVEKLQYKEILTPSWRVVDISSQPMSEDEILREVEDLSEAAFIQLHQAYEDQERSRWTWMALAPAKRRGSRSYKSVDGRTTPLLCGTNPPTPQPASPDPGHCPMLHDYSHVPSPMSPASPDTTSNPHTPCSRDSHRLLSSEDTRCSTPDFTFEERTVAPWESRFFPLSEDPAPEPESESDHIRPRLHSISGCRAMGFGRLDSDDMDLPCGGGGGDDDDDDDGSGLKLKAAAQR
ncbi:KAT8 regulatory NSL complex subunit 1-like isoform X2 [Genypterus blacodes]|uniref:KAT8 regulatory NSL complex subunit 1-like isoform X2 n=1 Tax=Genypterus blacodes TaxID=154954 RepID=UPI003F76960E